VVDPTFSTAVRKKCSWIWGSSSSLLALFVILYSIS
jgi:hypothetical protein